MISGKTFSPEENPLFSLGVFLILHYSAIPKDRKFLQHFWRFSVKCYSLGGMDLFHLFLFLRSFSPSWPSLSFSPHSLPDNTLGITWFADLNASFWEHLQMKATRSGKHSALTNGRSFSPADNTQL